MFIHCRKHSMSANLNSTSIDVFYRLFNHQEINSLWCFFRPLPSFFLPFFISVATYMSLFLHCIAREFFNYSYILRTISEIRNINFDGIGNYAWLVDYWACNMLYLMLLQSSIVNMFFVSRILRIKNFVQYSL